MRKIELYFHPDTEELSLVIPDLTMSERFRYYRLLQKFFDDIPVCSFVCNDSTGIPEALVLFVR